MYRSLKVLSVSQLFTTAQTVSLKIVLRWLYYFKVYNKLFAIQYTIYTAVNCISHHIGSYLLLPVLEVGEEVSKGNKLQGQCKWQCSGDTAHHLDHMAALPSGHLLHHGNLLQEVLYLSLLCTSCSSHQQCLCDYSQHKQKMFNSFCVCVRITYVQYSFCIINIFIC